MAKVKEEEVIVEVKKEIKKDNLKAKELFLKVQGNITGVYRLSFEDLQEIASFLNSL